MTSYYSTAAAARPGQLVIAGCRQAHWALIPVMCAQKRASKAAKRGKVKKLMEFQGKFDGKVSSALPVSGFRGAYESIGAGRQGECVCLCLSQPVPPPLC